MHFLMGPAHFLFSLSGGWHEVVPDQVRWHPLELMAAEIEWRERSLARKKTFLRRQLLNGKATAPGTNSSSTVTFFKYRRFAMLALGVGQSLFGGQYTVKQPASAFLLG